MVCGKCGDGERERERECQAKSCSTGQNVRTNVERMGKSRWKMDKDERKLRMFMFASGFPSVFTGRRIDRN
jgi:hypothetical protein